MKDGIMSLKRAREGNAAFIPHENEEADLKQAEGLRKSSSVF
jgi:hypothetical protein